MMPRSSPEHTAVLGMGTSCLLLQRQCSCSTSPAPAEPGWSARPLPAPHLLPLPRVRKQVVNIPSFIVRLDSQKHIDFSLRSPYGGGRPGRVKRKNAKKGQGGAGAGDDEEED